MSSTSDPTSTSSYEFVPPTSEDSRSPCPALNSLANHGYLPHDGRNLTFSQLVRGIREVYHISLPMATLLSIAGVVVCGNGFSLSLEDLAKHNKIEHDGSLAHADALPGFLYAPCPVDKDRLQQLLDAATSTTADGQEAYTFQDLVSQRASRDAVLLSLSKPLDSVHRIISQGELALTFEVFGDKDGKVRKEWVRQWYGEERLPEGWTRPQCPVGLIGTSKISGEVGKMAKAMSKQETRE